MTREEAIKFWKFRYENAKDYTDPHWEASERKDHRRYVDALKAAIEALSERTGEQICEVNRMDDLISRQAAIEAVRKIIPIETEIDATPLDKAEVIVELSALPSAEAEPKTGKWVKIIDEETPNLTKWHYECDQCGAGRWEEGQRYCQNCGARMIREDGEA